MIDNASAPVISIITVTLNNGPGLERTIQSVKCQTFKSYEHIIIDGGSKDETLAIINKYSDSIALWISEPDDGIYDAMNKGMSMAKGKYLNFLNAGDTYLDKLTLEKLFAAKNSEEYDIIYGNIIVLENRNDGSYLQKARSFNKLQLLKYGTGVLCHQAMFVKRSIAPGYDKSWRFKAELNWYFDIVDSTPDLKTLHIDIPVVYYSLGGYGQVHFWTNQVEWFNIVIKRYGWIQIIQYSLPLKLLLKLPYRYKWIRKFLRSTEA